MDQMRLLWATGLTALPVICGYRLARRMESPLYASADAILLGYLVQYLAVGAAGLLGCLTAGALTAFTLALCAALLAIARRVPPQSEIAAAPPRHQPIVLGISLAAVGFLAAIIYVERFQPPQATDAITYHLPAAVAWLQKKRLALFPAWFFNPANTYSPLGGSIFVAWLLAPMGNDSLARFVQAGPWFLILLSTISLARSAGAGWAAAALSGLAAVLSRPFISESLLVKDDLFVTAFFLTTAAAMAPDRCSKRLAPWRLGISLGLLLAIKYTVALSLPLLLLAADGPIRSGWRWRQCSIVAACIAGVAGPWYLRNAIEFGNPVFPVKLGVLGIRLPGLVSSVHVKAFETLAGIWGNLTSGYYGLPPVLFVFLAIVWLAALVRLRKSWFRDPVRRLLAIGPPLGIALYLLLSPQSEARFLYPTWSIWIAGSAIALGGGRGAAVAAVMATIALCTSFATAEAGQMAMFVLVGLPVAIVGLGIRWVERDWLALGGPPISGASVATLLLCLCVRWNRYIAEYRDGRFIDWGTVYPAHAVAWSFIDDHVPEDATIAYASEYMIYPLYGFDLRRPAVYAPVRAGEKISNLKFPDHMSDGGLFDESMRAADADPDKAVWLKSLRQAGAEYLFVGIRQTLPVRAPEANWAQADRRHFTKIFVNEEAAVYRIHGIE